jgi:hypothetical protein
MRIIRIRWQNALNTITNILTQVSVPVENESQQSTTFTHALKGLALAFPIMPLADQHFRAHFESYKLSTNNQIFINNKESIHCANISTKITNNQIRP